MRAELKAECGDVCLRGWWFKGTDTAARVAEGCASALGLNPGRISRAGALDERAAESRQDPPDGVGLLAIEDFVECYRDRCVHRIGAWARALRCAPRSTRPASAIGPRCSGHPGGTRVPVAHRRPLRQHS